jgi:hypothetical protein
MRCRNRGILDLIDDFRVLRFHCESHMLSLNADWLIEVFLVECVVLLIILTIGYIESVIPSTRMQRRIFLARSS